MLAANSAVMHPVQVTTCRALETALGSPATALISGYVRATRNTPAATIVAAWINALTGVGPSIASGSQTCSGTWPDLPTAPQKINNGITTLTASPPAVVTASNRPTAASSRQPRPSS